MSDTEQYRELLRKASIYDALTAEPGPEDRETLEEWHRLVKNVEWTIGTLIRRCQRIESHLATRPTP